MPRPMRPARPIATARAAASFRAAASRSPLRPGTGWPRSSIWPAFSPPSAAPAASRFSVPPRGSRCSPCRLRRWRRDATVRTSVWAGTPSAKSPGESNFIRWVRQRACGRYIEHRRDGIDWVLLLNSDGQVPGSAAGRGRDHRQDSPGDRCHPRLARSRSLRSPAAAPAPRQKPTGSVVL